MANSIPVSPSAQINSRTHLRVIRDEEPAPYDGQPRAPRESSYVCVVNTDVTRTILGTLGTTAHGVYAFLDTYCDQDREAWPSIETIATGTRLSARTVQRVIAELVAAGWIIRREKKNRFGFVNGVVYTLPNHTTQSDKTGDIGATRPRHDDDKNVTQGNTKVVPKVEPSTRSAAPPLDDASNERLQTFKLAYPVKRRSANARALAQEWVPLTIAEQEAAIASLSVFVTSKEWQDEDGRYIPNILKFLNERRWESVPQPGKVSIRPGDYGYHGSTGWAEFKQAVRRGEIAGVTPAMVEARA